MFEVLSTWSITSSGINAIGDLDGLSRTEPGRDFSLSILKHRDGRAAPPLIHFGEVKILHQGMARQIRMHRFPENPRPLAMNHPNLPYPLDKGPIQILVQASGGLLHGTTDQVDLRGDGLGFLYEERHLSPRRWRRAEHAEGRDRQGVAARVPPPPPGPPAPA